MTLRNAAQPVPEHNDDDLRVARRIAVAVILQAQKDIHMEWPYDCGQRNPIGQIKDRARAWVRSDRTGWSPETGCTFRTCCELLELNERVTRKRVLEHAATKTGPITESSEEDEL